MLEKNICDVVKEEQIKLGYRKEKIHLYYPLASLQHILNVGGDSSDMLLLMEKFKRKEKERLGDIEISHQGERFCFSLSEEAVVYIHENYEGSPFLKFFISLVSKHGVSMEDVFSVFRKYSDHVHVEKVRHGEFDYLVYFEDGKPDDFRYCLTDEGGHIIYHRFTLTDYNDFGFF